MIECPVARHLAEEHPLISEYRLYQDGRIEVDLLLDPEWFARNETLRPLIMANKPQDAPQLRTSCGPWARTRDL